VRIGVFVTSRVLAWMLLSSWNIKE
jgi:hypothetical protein